MGVANDFCLESKSTLASTFILTRSIFNPQPTRRSLHHIHHREKSRSTPKATRVELVIIMKMYTAKSDLGHEHVLNEL